MHFGQLVVCYELSNYLLLQVILVVIWNRTLKVEVFLLELRKDLVVVRDAWVKALLVGLKSFYRFFFSKGKNQPWVDSASLLEQQIIKMHDLTVSVTFAKAARLNEVRKVVGIGQLVNKMVVSLGILC